MKEYDVTWLGIKWQKMTDLRGSFLFEENEVCKIERLKVGESLSLDNESLQVVRVK
jgi:hypothetical protein